MLKEHITLYKYIDELLKNQNITNTPCLQDIFSRRDYYHLLKGVLEVIKENPTASITTLRFQLFQKSGLQPIIYDFIHAREITPGVILDFGTSLTRDIVICGNSQEYIYENGEFVYNPKPIEQDTIFDLASTSKLFTALSILLLEEMRLLDLYAPITQYDPRFTNLSDVTVYDLLKFNVNIGTDKRIDTVKTQEEAEAILFSTYKRENQNIPNAYTDMGAMILRYIVEKVSKMPFAEFVQAAILQPCKMYDTHLNVPETKKNRVANENYSTIIDANGRAITRFDNYPGTTYDAKSLAIGHQEGIAPGHAGYFSTKKDMLLLADALINNKLLSQESLFSISDNIVGTTEDDHFTRFYGSLVYLKQPDPNFLSVYPPLSGKSFMSPGFSGTTLCIDPLNKITMFIGSNRLHNRIYQIHPSQTHNIITEYPSMKKTYRMPDGSQKIICSSFTGDKEIMVKRALDLCLQYQLLEKIFQPKKPLHLVRELS